MREGVDLSQKPPLFLLGGDYEAFVDANHFQLVISVGGQVFVLRFDAFDLVLAILNDVDLVGDASLTPLDL